MKKLICLFLFALVGMTAFAQVQNDEYAKSKEILQLLKNGKGSELYAMLDANAQKNISVEQLNTLWGGLTKLYGACDGQGNWETTTLMGQEIQFVDLKFSSIPLRFLTSFDKDGKANTLRFIPAPATIPANR